jgi:hypothetical protein
MHAAGGCMLAVEVSSVAAVWWLVCLSESATLARAWLVLQSITLGIRTFQYLQRLSIILGGVCASAQLTAEQHCRSGMDPLVLVYFCVTLHSDKLFMHCTAGGMRHLRQHVAGGSCCALGSTVDCPRRCAAQHSRKCIHSSTHQQPAA